MTRKTALKIAEKAASLNFERCGIVDVDKMREYGAKVVAMSDSDGCIYDGNGIDLDLVKQIKEAERGRIKEYLNTHPQAEYLSDTWSIKADIALPCATQNEIDLDSAKKLAENGVIAVGEGANMPLTKEAANYLLEKGVLIAPAKAANAGGVSVSAIEMSQNSMRYYRSFEDVDKQLDSVMTNIFNDCKQAAQQYGYGKNYVAGANIAAFLKLSEAMLAQGVV
jgi:glutamate dehydrogenase (NADP+)